MRPFATLIAILLLLTSVAPVLACVTGEAMSQQEGACCREMRDASGKAQCREMAKTGCCRTEARADENPQIAAIASSTDVQWVCVAQLAPTANMALKLASLASQARLEHSPPGLLAAKVTVLRI